MRQRYRVSSYFLQKWAIILLHQSQLDINRAVGTFRSRCRGCRRRRCHRYGVREGLLLIQVVLTKKGADEANRNRRWCRCLLPTKEKPLFYVGKAQDKGFMEKGGLGEIPLQRSFIVFVCFYILLISSSSCFLQIKAPPTEKINVKINTASA